MHNFMHDVVFTKLNGEMAKIIHGKMARIDPVCLEDTKLHDDINKAQEGAWTVSVILNIGITIFTFYIPYFAFMGIYLYYLKPQFILTIVLVFIPVLAGQLMRTGIIAKFETRPPRSDRNMSTMRRLSLTGIFQETRILGAFRFLSPDS